jgi:hypothetical protein
VQIVSALIKGRDTTVAGEDCEQSKKMNASMGLSPMLPIILEKFFEATKKGPGIFPVLSQINYLVYLLISLAARTLDHGCGAGANPTAKTAKKIPPCHNCGFAGGNRSLLNLNDFNLLHFDNLNWNLLKNDQATALTQGSGTSDLNGGAVASRSSSLGSITSLSGDKRNSRSCESKNEITHC